MAPLYINTLLFIIYYSAFILKQLQELLQILQYLQVNMETVVNYVFTVYFAVKQVQYREKPQISRRAVRLPEPFCSTTTASLAWA